MRYRNLIEERYIISKFCNTSYLDVGEISPSERKYIVQIIMDEKEREKEAYQRLQNDIKKK